MLLVAIIGRPNVGKSTLFNRLTRTKKAIVDDSAGITRDRLYSEAEWNGKRFAVVDTGGFVPKTYDNIEKAVREQAMIAIEEADFVLFVCDGRSGITASDEEIAKILRKTTKKVLLLINKCDNVEQDYNVFEFHKLGLGVPYPISAINGRNTGDFLDDLVSKFSTEETKRIDPLLKIAIIGRPNVGKSSLVNSLLGNNRSIVTDIPGTTRDSIDTLLRYYGEEIILIDTAGLRRKSSIKENVEFYSVLRTFHAIKRSDVSVVVLDATRGLEEQDKKIINQVDEARKGIIIALNKWDLIENKDSKTSEEIKSKIYSDLPNYYYVPILFVSAKTKQRIIKIIEISREIKKYRNLRITTSQLNRDLLLELEKNPPPSIRGKDLRINFVTQAKTEPPVFVFFCNHPTLIPESYKRNLEKILRSKYNFTGTPISFLFRRKNIPWKEIKEL